MVSVCKEGRNNPFNQLKLIQTKTDGIVRK